MEIILDSEIIDKLSANGVMAYIAVKRADGTEATTAALAGLVRCRTGVMLDGIKELSVAVPELVAKAPKNKWRCGVVKAGDGVLLQSLESERYREFVDLLKKYWDALNPNIPFSMGGREGMAIRRFLQDHHEWGMDELTLMVRHRFLSVRDYGHRTRSESFVGWIGKLGDYAAGPLDGYNRPVQGASNGKAAIREQSNRQGNAEYVASRL